MDLTIFAIRDALEELKTVSHAFEDGFYQRRGRDGLVHFVVVGGRCPLCIETLDCKADYLDLEKQSAIILLPSLIYRCKRHECPAGAEFTGYNQAAKVAGLPYPQWLRYLGM